MEIYDDGDERSWIVFSVKLLIFAESFRGGGFDIDAKIWGIIEGILGKDVEMEILWIVWFMLEPTDLCRVMG